VESERRSKCPAVCRGPESNQFVVYPLQRHTSCGPSGHYLANNNSPVRSGSIPGAFWCSLSSVTSGRGFFFCKSVVGWQEKLHRFVPTL
uniref:Uncharacterized protein n=1 Tax=Anopheles minimus TaxID=112268 RepID=A0A182WPK9_9DIPT